MKATLKWIGGMKFEAATNEHKVVTDVKAPLGTNQGMSPKEMVVAGMAGCTAMDVAALFKKHKQQVESFEVSADAALSSGVYPAVFTDALIVFEAKGPIDKSVYLEAVTLSQTKYCGVSAMLAKAFPIRYQVKLNGELIGEGKADFGGVL